MPILDVDKAKAVIVYKRSMNPGFAGIDNELYIQPHTYMLFGDAKSTAQAGRCDETAGIGVGGNPLGSFIAGQARGLPLPIYFVFM
jgi:hypothetical protein